LSVERQACGAPDIGERQFFWRSLEKAVLVALVGAGGLGLLLGLRYRVPALLVASAVVAAAATAAACLTESAPWAVLILPFGAVAALQCGYLCGVALAFAAHGRARARAPDAKRFEEASR
jgi:hypothetical protein